ncbi:MAG: pantoate--beta-alanine ligase [Psychroflexus sp.]|nr:pantoate--beta-alanine ligase [Psychroflexus sp.]MDR9449189.1 pantoate--beta-alanine ligase [Psychroflexus sp.]
MVYSTNDALQQEIQQQKEKGKTIGLVPTMGALHQGHIDLITDAAAKCDIVVISIFVNPTQFNDASDLENYPREVDQDVQMIHRLEVDTIVYTPSVEAVYGNAVKTIDYDFGSIIQYMEGQYRKGHFGGVGTVIKHLFDIVQPHKAFFGEKDYQQLRLIQLLVKKTGQPVQIIGCATSREESGLARSSRNKRLNADQLQQAAIIPKALELARSHFHQKTIVGIKRDIRNMFADSPVELEYFEIAPITDLIPVDEAVEGEDHRAFIAAFVNGVRLIDNKLLDGYAHG